MQEICLFASPLIHCIHSFLDSSFLTTIAATIAAFLAYKIGFRQVWLMNEQVELDKMTADAFSMNLRTERIQNNGVIYLVFKLENTGNTHVFVEFENDPEEGIKFGYTGSYYLSGRGVFELQDSFTGNMLEQSIKTGEVQTKNINFIVRNVLGTRYLMKNRVSVSKNKGIISVAVHTLEVQKLDSKN